VNGAGDLQVMPGLRFGCTNCGSCCQQWGVEVSESEKQRIEQLAWTTVAEARPGERFFQRAGAGSESRWLLGLQASGKCRFLDENKLCIIHKHFGAEAKPLRCRQFPYQFARSPTGIYTSLSYASTGARLNWGPELREERDKLLALFQAAGPDREHGETVALTEECSVSWAEYLSLEDGVRATIAASAAGRFWDGLIAAESLLMQRAGESLPESRVAGAGHFNWRRRAILGLSLVAFLREEVVEGSGPIGRGGAAVSDLLGVIAPLVLQGRMRLAGGCMTMDELSELQLVKVDAEGEAMVRRFFDQTLFGKLYFSRWRSGETLSVLAGFRYLMLQYVLTLFWLRAKVWRERGSTAGAAEMSAALGITCRSVQHRQAVSGGWLPAERFVALMRAVLPQIIPPD
jgi:Fe-S-cluster containining protein